ncbi:MAG: hypothetical protein JWN22_2371 [Nocardioides sp.]|jgi:hypothetical protein|nr:hypothetical protein [Nocardioides sp.]
MTSRLPLRAALTSAAAAVALLGGTLLAQPASADGETEPPVAVDDTYTWYAGGSGVLDVLANDTDPQDAELAVCKVKSDETSDIGAAMLLDDTIFAFTAIEPTGDFVFRYYACNDEFLTPATVTIAFKHAKPLRVHKVAGRPGRLEVRNPNDQTVKFLWGNRRTISDVTRVPASGSRIVKVTASKLRWIGLIGRENGYAGYGVVRNIDVPDHSRPASQHISPRLQGIWARHR